MMSKLGILAGGGFLPVQIIKACREQQRPFFVIAFEGHADPSILEDTPHIWNRLGAAGSIIEKLRQENVKEIVMAGHVRRPSLAELKPDWRAAKFFARIGLRALGDDSLLSAVAKELESEGFKVISTQDILPQVLAHSGVWGKVHPDESAWGDIRRGIEVVQALGRLDVGQAAVIQQGLVLGVEAIEGTNELIRRCASLKREGPGGVLVKMSKPQQDRRVDLPTIGLSTVKNSAESGLRGIAVEANHTLVVDEIEIVKTADQLGLFIIGISASLDEEQNRNNIAR